MRNRGASQSDVNLMQENNEPPAVVVAPRRPTELNGIPRSMTCTEPSHDAHIGNASEREMKKQISFARRRAVSDANAESTDAPDLLSKMTYTTHSQSSIMPTLQNGRPATKIRMVQTKSWPPPNASVASPMDTAAKRDITDTEPTRASITPRTRRRDTVSTRNMSSASESVSRGCGQHKVCINVSGVRFETYKSTLKNQPDTRLGWLADCDVENCEYWDPVRNEFFFDRNPAVFASILEYYRSGRLHTPLELCGPIYEQELSFWGVDEKVIEPCCWKQYNSHRDAQEILHRISTKPGETDEEFDLETARIFGVEDGVVSKESGLKKVKRRVWTMLTEPLTSTASKIYAFISLPAIFLSIIIFSLETTNYGRIPIELNNESEPIPFDESWTPKQARYSTKPVMSIVVLEIGTTIFFTVDLFIRLITCPHIKRFAQDWMNWIEVLSIFPVYVLLVINPEHAMHDVPERAVIELCYFLRVFRIFRLFKLMKHITGLSIFWHTIRASARELFLVLLFLVIFITIFASLIYYAEQVAEVDDNNFTNIPYAMWWAVVTMTTLGYGDVHPKTFLGYIFGSTCAIAGVLVIAIPVPIVVNNFSLYYSHAQAAAKMPKRRQNIVANFSEELKQATENRLSGEAEESNVIVEDETESKMDVTALSAAASSMGAVMVARRWARNPKASTHRRRMALNTISEVERQESPVDASPLEDVGSPATTLSPTSLVMNARSLTNTPTLGEARNQFEIREYTESISDQV